VGSVPHQPVMREEVIHFLNVNPGGIYLDATVGAGGHAAAIAERLTGGLLIGLDRDESALEVASENLKRFGARVLLAHSAFSEFAGVLDHFKIDRVDGVLADLGVSSMQLAPERGFSFHSKEPLDMRMDRTSGETAAVLLARLPERELVRVIGALGEERYAGRIAGRIVREREKGFAFTGEELRRLVVESIPRSSARSGAVDPATRTFMGLRIAVNRELEELESFLPAVIGRAKPGTRIVVISFHSLEDRIVKQKFRQWERPEGGRKGLPAPGGFVRLAKVLTRKPVRSAEEEILANPRSRSARLRAVEVL